MNDFTGKELALILKQEAKMKFRLHKLTISKVLDRKGLANALKDLYYSLSIKERLHIIDNLPFIDEEMLAEKLHVKNTLSSYCEFTYEEIPFPGNENIITPPWESPLYISAKNWYNDLPKEDQEKIDILVQGNIAWG